MNHKRFRRLYSEEKLRAQRHRGRRRAIGVRAPLALPQGPKQRWSLDFVADQLTTGRRFRILTVVDDFTKESLATRIRRSPGGGWSPSSTRSSEDRGLADRLQHGPAAQLD
jgi:putative transposase